MKSKISCWRLVRSMPGCLRVRVDGALQRTCVRNVAPAVDGRKCAAIHPLAAGWSPGLYSPPCARGGIGRRARLRALSGVSRVVVRVHSGAPFVLRWNQDPQMPGVLRFVAPPRLGGDLAAAPEAGDVAEDGLLLAVDALAVDEEPL